MQLALQIHRDTKQHSIVHFATFCRFDQFHYIWQLKIYRVLHHLNNAEMSVNKYLKYNLMKTLTSKVQFGGTTLQRYYTALLLNIALVVSISVNRIQYTFSGGDTHLYV
ncbi:Hypothetical_protein [Hexamita inflata]|uniref:Hypothetical_protein n=1 Tax=Hexamita inflata TaxID=28002 RepID=A0AA86QHS2_9EUKA|nr:Hypothetical protein HINF_LOCUS41049 [Hexamita inflata]